MPRSGYSDDFENWEIIRWRGAVASAIRGKRGQAFLKEMLTALDAMEAKRLISRELIKEGEVCALGAVGVARGVDLSNLDPECREEVAHTFGIADALAAEIACMNDEMGTWQETPEQRYDRMRRWIIAEII